MALNPIKRGLKVQVEFETGSKRTILDTYILEPDSDRLTLSFPDSKREFAPYLREGTEIKAFIYTFTGIMIVNSIIYDSPFDGKFIIEFNEQHQIIQRRKYLRMPYITDFFIQREEGNIKANSVDIGGGGVRFITDYQLKAGQNYKIQLRLTPFEPMIKAEGIILKKNFYKSNEYVLEFMKIDEKERDKIVKKCLQIENAQNKTTM